MYTALREHFDDESLRQALTERLGVLEGEGKEEDTHGSLVKSRRNHIWHYLLSGKLLLIGGWL